MQLWGTMNDRVTVLTRLEISPRRDILRHDPVPNLTDVLFGLSWPTCALPIVSRTLICINSDTLTTVSATMTTGYRHRLILVTNEEIRIPVWI